MIDLTRYLLEKEVGVPDRKYCFKVRTLPFSGSNVRAVVVLTGVLFLFLGVDADADHHATQDVPD